MGIAEVGVQRARDATWMGEEAEDEAEEAAQHRAVEVLKRHASHLTHHAVALISRVCLHINISWETLKRSIDAWYLLVSISLG